VYLVIQVLHMGIFTAWSWALVYVMVLGTVFWLRFRSGYWKTIHMVSRDGSGR